MNEGRTMELLAPAGNIEKLEYAYRYGADAVYIGIGNFSLRQRADNFNEREFETIRRIKGGKKLYCALNIYFHDGDLERLEEAAEYIASYPFDAFIVSDPGVVGFLKRCFPNAALHLSTQANCVNSETAKLYRDLGFSRIIPGRELSLREIEKMKNAVPELELEIFVHGAMCLAYSGRCFLSAWMSGRSANRGDCAHSCRWKYRVLEEEERPGEYFPVIEGENFTTILSSRDLCLIDHLPALRDAGVDSLKIEGRMKSLYYTALVTRAYRKMLDALSGEAVDNLEGFREELMMVSRREYTTGFLFGREDVEKPTEISYIHSSDFIGTVGRPAGEGRFYLALRNGIRDTDTVEYIGPDVLFLTDNGFRLYGEGFTPISRGDHGKVCILETDAPVKEGYIIRRKIAKTPNGL